LTPARTDTSLRAVISPHLRGLAVVSLLVFETSGCIVVTRSGQARSNPGMEPESPAAPVASGFAEKQSEFDAKFAEEIAAYRALEPELEGASAEAGPAEKAESLRSRFLKRCIEESGWSTVACWNATFARNITEALAAIRLRQGDKVGAYIESSTLRHFTDMRSDKAKLRAVESPVALAPAVLATPDDVKPLLAELDLTAQEVQSIRKTKDTAVIQFKTHVSGMTSYSCGDPKLVVDQRGEVSVKRPCSATESRTDVERFAPVTVPLADVEGLEVGQRAFVVTPTKGKRVGRVVDVWPDIYTKKYIRYRATPMQPAKPGYP
jgi:hypothetical protein